MPDWVRYVREHLSLSDCPPDREAEIVEELAQQLDDAYQEELESGLNEQDALRSATCHIGDWPALANDIKHAGITHVRRGRTKRPARKELFDQRLLPSRTSNVEMGTPREGRMEARSKVCESVHQDLRYAVRMLKNKPLFALIAIVTIAIGVGANSAIFSVLNSVLLQPLSYPESSRLAVVWSTLGNEGRAPGSGPELMSLRERSRLFEQFAGIWVQSGALTGNGEPEQVKVGWVTANFLSLLSARAQAGRYFLSREEGEGKPPVAVLSDALWRKKYAGNRDLIGRTILFNGRAVTVVGILPPRFKLMFPEGASVPPSVDIYVPFPIDLRVQARDQDYIRIIGRLRDGATLQQGQAELDNIATQLRLEFPEYSQQNLRIQTFSLQTDLARAARPAILALTAGTSFVLLIVCANIAMLLLSRTSERRAEISVRAALGAQSGRLLRQLLTENLLLSFAGGIGGVVISWGVLHMLWMLEPDGIARAKPSGLSFSVLAFNLAISLLCGLLFGLLPALEARRVNLASVLRESVRNTSAGKSLTRQLLIGGQVALTFVLLIGSALFLRTFVGLMHVDPGFRAENVLTFQVSLPAVRYPNGHAAEQFLREAQRKLSALPGVQAAGVVSHLPFDDNLPNWYDYYWRDGAPSQEQNTLMADHRSVLPEFFDSMGVRFLAGRNFDVTDDVAHRKVVIIDDSLARKLWPGADPIGKKLNVQNGDFVRDVAEVVGVVKHVQYHSLVNQVRPQLYLPYALAARPNMFFTVRADADPAPLVPAIRQEMVKLDKDLPLANMSTMEDYVAKARLQTRFVTVLCGALAGIALLLSCVGVYSVTSNTVVGRTKELGIRMALGAQRRTVTWMILRESMLPVLWGALVGLALSFAVTPYLAVVFYGVHSATTGALLLVMALLWGVGLLAALLPTLRVLRANPITALRCE